MKIIIIDYDYHSQLDIYNSHFSIESGFHSQLVPYYWEWKEVTQSWGGERDANKRKYNQ